MRIHVHAMIWNEEKMLPYFLRHYETFCEKIFIRVFPSTDKTLEIAKNNSKVVLLEPECTFSKDLNKYNLKDQMKFKNEEWKKYSTSENCDWVILADCDEFIYHSNIVDLLSIYTEKGITFPKILGFQMYSEKPPSTNGQIYEEIRNGYPMAEYSKRAVLHPNIIPRYTPGCHSCNPNSSGEVVESSQKEIKLFHYSKQVWSRDELLDFWIKKMKRIAPEKNKGIPDEKFYIYAFNSLYNLYNLTIGNYMRYINENNVDRGIPYFDVVEDNINKGGK